MTKNTCEFSPHLNILFYDSGRRAITDPVGVKYMLCIFSVILSDMGKYTLNVGNKRLLGRLKIIDKRRTAHNSDVDIITDSIYVFSVPFNTTLHCLNLAIVIFPTFVPRGVLSVFVGLLQKHGYGHIMTWTCSGTFGLE